MAELPRWSYFGRFATLATASLCLLFFFVFGFLPQRFLLELDFSESGFAYPVIRPPLPVPPPPPPAYEIRRPVPRGPAERFWAEYLPLVRDDEHDAALELAADYLARFPEDLNARLEYARELWRAGRLNEAIVAYRDVLERGADPSVRLELARLYSAAADWDGALAIYENLAGESPDDTELLREFAEVATWAERYDRAERLYARLVVLAAGDPELRLQWARVLYWSERPEHAFAVLVDLPPDYQSASVDSLRAAIAVALPPPDAEPTLLERARGLAMAGAADSALALYRVILSEDPGADSITLEMANVFEYRADAPDSAIACLRAYLGRRPDDRDVQLRLARLLVWNGHLAEAEAETEALVTARPDDAEAWALLGDLRRWRGDRVGAAQAYQQSLEPRPGRGHGCWRSRRPQCSARRGTGTPGHGRPGGPRRLLRRLRRLLGRRLARRLDERVAADSNRRRTGARAARRLRAGGRTGRRDSARHPSHGRALVAAGRATYEGRAGRLGRGLGRRLSAGRRADRRGARPGRRCGPLRVPARAGVQGDGDAAGDAGRSARRRGGTRLLPFHRGADRFVDGGATRMALRAGRGQPAGRCRHRFLLPTGRWLDAGLREPRSELPRSRAGPGAAALLGPCVVVDELGGCRLDR
ncbi:MAG: tetratricopeptide repeat protein [Gemmatimonadetes bacterium]|nr:tetratricopeptide repeat protein [Gemmatimonadota bacterium]NIO31227.1 tetratricopeptide repeat protein [Gemmatimonadota bacterium]